MNTAYKVYPFDVLFFRKNKPFDFGEWYSEGHFPPLPSTFQGFVRTSILQKHNLIQNGQVNWTQAQPLIGDDNDFPLEIEGPYLITTNNSDEVLYFSTPHDVILENNGQTNNRTTDTGRQIQLSGSPINTDLGLLHWAEEDPKSKYFAEKYSFISINQLNEYRQTGLIPSPPPHLVETEDHYGIQLEKNKQVVEHHFYLTPYQRLAPNAAFYFNIHHVAGKSLQNLTGIYSRLGSEGRGASIEPTRAQLNVQLNDAFYTSLANAQMFKLIFLQPAVLPDNFLPFRTPTGNASIEISWNELTLQLLYCTIKERLRISGVNFKQKSQNPENNDEKRTESYRLKPMVNAIPAGSVFYFKILQGPDNLARYLQQLDGGKIEHFPYSNMGFNQVVMGKII